ALLLLYVFRIFKCNMSSFRFLNLVLFLLLTGHSVEAGYRSRHSRLHSDYLLVTRDTLNQYPDSLLIEGKIVDYSDGASCGGFCESGSLKIQLQQNNNSYSHTYIYVLVPCLD